MCPLFRQFVRAVPTALLAVIPLWFGTLAGEHSARGQEPSRPVPSVEELQRWVRQLDSDRFRERQEAMRRLQDSGDAAFAALLDASRSSSPEVRSRAAWILRDSHERMLVSAFRDFANRSDEQLDLEYGMWLIARILDPHVSRKELTNQLDALAERVGRKLGPGVSGQTCDPQVAVATVVKVLFEEEKFTGAEQDYRNPDNSSLQRVLARRRGLPILLSHLVIAVGQRRGIPLVGVATPGRYLVRYDGAQAPAGFPKTDIYLDPFGNGRILEPEDLRRMFPGISQDSLQARTGSRETLIRMLNNLETHLFESRDFVRAGLALNFRVLLVENEDPFGSE